MTLDDIMRRFYEREAIKNYTKVKVERDKLLEEVEQLRKQLIDRGPR